MKKILSLVLAAGMLLSAMSVFAADASMDSTSVSGIEVSKHGETDVVYIKGQLATKNLSTDPQTITVLIQNGDGSTIYYIEELTTAGFGEYEAKFVCDVPENAVIKIKHEGSDVTDSLTVATINGKSNIMKASIYLLNERGSLFSKEARNEFEIHDDFVTETTGEQRTYQSMYQDEFQEGASAAQAYIKVENAYGISEELTPIIAFYGENNKLIETRIFDVEEFNFADVEKTICTDTIDLPEGTLRVKAFAWDKDTLVPFGDSNEGTLDPIQVILVGSSAAQTWMGTTTGAYPGEGYGLLLGDFFNTDYVTYYNKAVSGASAPSFFLGKKGNWNSEETRQADGVIDIVKAGNAQGKKSYVIVELGGNDLKGTYYPGWTEDNTNGGTYNEENYKAYLMRMYNEVAALGGQVIFSNSSGPINGTLYNENGEHFDFAADDRTKIYKDKNQKNLFERGTTFGQFELTDEGKMIIHPNASRQQASEYRKDLAELTGTPYIDAVPAIYDNYTYVLNEVFDGNLDDLRGYYLRDTRYMVMPYEPDVEWSPGWGLDPSDAVLESGNTGTDADNYYQDFSHTNLRGADANAYYTYKAILDSDCELKLYMR